MENPNLQTLGERLAWLIRHRGYNASEVSRATGVPNSTLSEICGKDGRHPRAGHFLALCDFLNVQPEWLLRGTGPMNTYSLNEEEMELVRQFRLLDARSQEEFFGLSAAMLMRQRDALDKVLTHMQPKHGAPSSATANLVTAAAEKSRSDGVSKIRQTIDGAKSLAPSRAVS